MKFYIVNCMDKPHPPLVAYLTETGKLNYLDRSKHQYDGMGIGQATPIEDFGFDVEFGRTEVLFRKVRPSVAEYRDGKARDWQGDTIFSRSTEAIQDAA